MNYASWVRRVAASFVDALIFAPLFVFVAIFEPKGDPTTGAALVYLGASLITFVLVSYNRWYLGGKTGQTWGRKAVGIKLVSERTGQPIGPRMAVVRDIAHLLDDLSFYIGYLIPLRSSKRQTIADKVVKSVVVVG
jgi:uncharacterized RDD family membrane protein YckC